MLELEGVIHTLWHHHPCVVTESPFSELLSSCEHSHRHVHCWRFCWGVRSAGVNVLIELFGGGGGGRMPEGTCLVPGCNKCRVREL